MQEFSAYIEAFHLDFVVFVPDTHVEPVAGVSAHNGAHMPRYILDQGLEPDGVNISEVDHDGKLSSIQEAKLVRIGSRFTIKKL